MSTERLTIGQAAKRAGVTVKTLRFYSDAGLLPPSARSRSGYRLYSESDLARLDLIRSLREAGLSLDSIRKVLRRDLSLTDALRLRLAAVDAHITSLRQVAAALRAALRSEPTEHDLRRLTTVTHLSNEERRAMIEKFYQRVAEGIPIDAQWMRAQIEASAPPLPDDPTPAQLDAWIEMAEIITAPEVLTSLRANAKEVWREGFDLAAMQAANAEAIASAKDARARSVAPTSAEARPVVERYLAGLARASGAAVDAKFRTGVLAGFQRQDPRVARYWELVAILGGKMPMSDHVAEWKWIAAAVLHHLANE